MDPDFEELSNDVDLISRIKQFRGATDNIANILQLVDNQEFYDKLSNADKIKYNLLMSFGLNTLFWMNLRLEGIDPSTHRIKAENERLKQSMARSQEINDRKTIMPRINKNVAQRLIKSGLWTPRNNNKDNSEQEQENSNEMEEDWDETPPTLDEQVEETPQTTNSKESSVS